MASEIEKMMAYRTDGMAFALEIVKKGGIEALEREVDFRKKSGVSLRMTEKELAAATTKIKDRTVDTISCLSLLTLRDEFDFGPKRARRFINRFWAKADVLIKDYAVWDDYKQIVLDEMGIELTIRENG